KEITTYNAQQVAEQKGHQEIEKVTRSSVSERKNGKSHGHRKPEKVEETAHDIEKRDAVYQPVFIWGGAFAIVCDTEPAFFKLVEFFNGYVFVQIVWKGFQVVV